MRTECISAPWLTAAILLGAWAVERTIRVDLYYTGLTETARIRQEEATPREYRLGRRYRIDLPVKVPPQGMTWFVIE